MVAKTEQEQLEDIKHWWEKNGKFVLVVIVLAFSGAIGGKVWRDYQAATEERLSVEYETLLQQVQNGDADQALQLGSRFIEQNSDSGYAVLVALALAKLEAERSQLDNARLRLQWALEQAPDAALAHVARLRLARVLMAQDQLDQALSLASVTETGEFAHNYAAIKGDIYRRKGDTALARTAYQAALDDSDTSPQLRNLLQMKLDALGGAND